MKKLSIVLTSFILCVTLFTACNNNSQGEATVADSNSKETITPTSLITPTVTATAPTATDVPNKIEIPDLTFTKKELPTNKAITFVQEMKIGWNLGNTFDAVSDTNLSDELKYETSWCGIKTTKEMIDTLKSQGFSSIRIPVSWHNHVSFDDFTISDVWLTRVQEVVDYAIENDMYVILNTHHDNKKEFYYPSKEDLENSKKYLHAIWSQLSNRFADYGETLIFEGMNEPRLTGTNYEWWLDLNNIECKEAIDCVNQLNQEFVDTVRQAGGKNQTRYLMVPGYVASSQYATNHNFILPTDSVPDRLIISVHAYTPYNFALQSPTESGSVSEWSSKLNGCTKEIDAFMNSLYEKFISKGVPVIIGEFGARAKGDNLNSRIDYASYYVGYARSNGITCFWWDNNSFSGAGENFAIFDRKTNTFPCPELVQGMMNYCE